MPKILGREPALWLALIAAALKLVGAFWLNLTPDMQAWLNAAAAAGMGLVVAVMVRDGIVAAVIGLAQAMLALAVGLGLDWSAEQQAVFMGFVTLAAGAFERTQVVAPVPADAVDNQVVR
jgi:hypothetical protein